MHHMSRQWKSKMHHLPRTCPVKDLHSTYCQMVYVGICLCLGSLWQIDTKCWNHNVFQFHVCLFTFEGPITRKIISSNGLKVVQKTKLLVRKELKYFTKNILGWAWNHNLFGRRIFRVPNAMLINNIPYYIYFYAI